MGSMTITRSGQVLSALEIPAIEDRAEELAQEFDRVGVQQVGGTGGPVLVSCFEGGRKARVELWSVATERRLRVDVIPEVSTR